MPRKKNATPTAAQKAEIITYKGFDRDLKCLGFQYEIGKTYTHDGEVVRCAAGGFHSCENPLDTWSYYAPNASRFAEVVASGQIDRDEGGDSKIASAEITIRAELKLPGIIKRAAYWLTEMIAATTGNYAHAATTGNYAHAATTGNSAHAATTGNYAHAATTGYGSHAATTGYRAHAATTGYGSHAATTCYSAHAATTGDSAHAATTGNSAHAATTGYRAHAATTGNSAHAATTGDDAIASALGIQGTAKAGDGGWIVLAAWEWTGERHKLLTVKTAKVGGPEGIQADVFYRLNDSGEFERAEEEGV